VLAGNALKGIPCSLPKVKWWLDSPVSNSGRLLTFLAELSERKGYDWEMELVFDPDKVLAISKFVVVTSDGEILDVAKNWFNLGSYLIDNCLKEVKVLIG